MYNMLKSRRRRGYLATPEGLEKLKDAKFKGGYTYESLAEMADVSLDRVKRFFNPHWQRPVEEKVVENIARIVGLQPKDIAEPVTFLEDPHDFYVERPSIESVCYREVLQPGSLLRIKAPKRMGKTLLMSKVLNHAANHDYRTVAVPLRLAVDKDYTNLDRFLRFFCASISLKQELPNMVDEHWDKNIGNSKIKCERYFEEYLLASECPLVLALDELDRIYLSPRIAEEFLGMLRAWYESAKTKKIWRSLRLVIVYMQDYTQINSNQSPFNVGEVVKLLPFEEDQVCKLVQMYELTWNKTQVKQLRNMVGGLPFLVHRAISHLKDFTDTTLEEFLLKAPTFEGIYSEHLQGLLMNLQQQLELVEALKQVVNADSPVQLEREQASKLHSMGLVQFQGNQVKPSSKLYRQFFHEQL